MWGTTVAVVARLGLAVVWAWAAIAKLGDADAAVRAVRAYEILPEVLVKPFAWGLPFVELALAVLLLVGIGTRIAGWISAAIMVVFMAGIVSAWVRGIQIDCGCFGGGGPAEVDGWTYAGELLRDGFFLLLSLVVALGPRSPYSLDALFDPDDSEDTEGEIP
ncbi:MAG: MauE/DoxX family redox-associated membrane protein [Acidimicrobiia bacterium]